MQEVILQGLIAIVMCAHRLTEMGDVHTSFFLRFQASFCHLSQYFRVLRIAGLPKCYMTSSLGYLRRSDDHEVFEKPESYKYACLNFSFKKKTC